MKASEYLVHLREDGAALAEAARQGLEPVVPGCPEWTVRDLVAHTGVVHRHKEAIVRNRLREPPRERIEPPLTGDLLDWYEEGLELLIDALGSTDPETPVWTWHEPDRTAGFWCRRMAHETAIHRVDAQASHGVADPVSAELALDGIDEILDVMLVGGLRGEEVGGDRQTIHLHATDGEGEWTLRLLPDAIELARGHGRGDASARGPASDLLLFLWGRGRVQKLEVFGDPLLLDRLRQLAIRVTQ